MKTKGKKTRTPFKKNWRKQWRKLVHDVLFILGDLNAKVGTNNEGK